MKQIASLPTRLSAPLRRPLAGLLLAALVSSPALAETNCFSATGPVSRQEWSTARAELEMRLQEPNCAPHHPSLRFTLAYVVEQQSHVHQPEACTAAELYRRVLSTADEEEVVREALKGKSRMETACRELTAGRADESTWMEPDTHELTTVPTADATGEMSGDDSAWGLAALSLTSIAAGGLLVWFATETDADRQAAEIELEDATTTAEQDAALSRFDKAAGRTTILAISGYTALALGAGLGIAALVSGSDDEPASVSVGPGSLTFRARF